jgi:signal transduction histidine kinase
VENAWDYPRPPAAERCPRLANALQAMAAELASARRECRERERQVGQLRASHDALAVELAESRARLVNAADAERRRLERDLHDGVQQDLIAIRLRLDEAVEAIEADRAHAEQMLMTVGAQLGAAVDSLRSLARGIYPALLRDRGVADALRSAALRLPIPVTVEHVTDRWSERVEVAVYFCCLEALQNVTKHAGAGVTARVSFWHKRGSLHFGVQDDGSGFELRDIPLGSGLTNMRDRIAAVGGTLAIASRAGHGTTVRGRVPVAPEAPPLEQDRGAGCAAVGRQRDENAGMKALVERESRAAIR